LYCWLVQPEEKVFTDALRQLERTSPEAFTQYDTEWRRYGPYYQNGQAFEDGAVRDPSLPPDLLDDLNKIIQNAKRNFGWRVGGKAEATGLIMLMDFQRKLEKEHPDEVIPPSDFMETLQENLTEKLAEYYGLEEDISEHVHFYSTLHTELDKMGVDFFYVIDGEVMPDGKSRLIKCDITINSKKLNDDKENECRRNETCVILNMQELRNTGEFRRTEPEFIVALCNERPLQELGRTNPVADARILRLAELAAEEIVNELKRSREIGKSKDFFLDDISEAVYGETKVRKRRMVDVTPDMQRKRRRRA